MFYQAKMSIGQTCRKLGTIFMSCIQTEDNSVRETNSVMSNFARTLRRNFAAILNSGLTVYT